MEVDLAEQLRTVSRNYTPELRFTFVPIIQTEGTNRWQSTQLQSSEPRTVNGGPSISQHTRVRIYARAYFAQIQTKDLKE
jgi:hypothetical protein